MNILHITRAHTTDSKYGIHKSLLPVVNLLRDRGHGVEVLDLNKAHRTPLNQREALLVKGCLAWIHTRLGKNDHTAWRIMQERVEVGIRSAKIAARGGITHVHCHDPLLGYMYDFFRKIYCPTANWGITEHAFGRFVAPRRGIEITTRSLKLLQKLELRATQKARWILFPTQSGMNRFFEEMSLKKPLTSCHTVPHAIQIRLTNRARARKELTITKDENLLIAAGQLIPMKRFDLLLQAAALLPRAVMPKIIILGEGPEHQTLIERAKALQLAGQLTITATDAIDQYLSAADIYVSTSSSEAFGLANCEALAAGVPSVLTAVDAVPELAGDAALLTTDDPREIAEAIHRILSSAEMRQKLKTRAKARTALWPGPQAIADRMIEIYAACC